MADSSEGVWESSGRTQYLFRQSRQNHSRVLSEDDVGAEIEVGLFTVDDHKTAAGIQRLDREDGRRCHLKRRSYHQDQIALGNQRFGFLNDLKWAAAHRRERRRV